MAQMELHDHQKQALAALRVKLLGPSGGPVFDASELMVLGKRVAVPSVVGVGVRHSMGLAAAKNGGKALVITDLQLLHSYETLHQHNWLHALGKMQVVRSQQEISPEAAVVVTTPRLAARMIDALAKAGFTTAIIDTVKRPEQKLVDLLKVIPKVLVRIERGPEVNDELGLASMDAMMFNFGGHQHLPRMKAVIPPAITFIKPGSMDGHIKELLDAKRKAIDRGPHLIDGEVISKPPAVGYSMPSYDQSVIRSKRALEDDSSVAPTIAGPKSSEEPRMG